MFKALKESSIRLAENWPVYRNFSWSEKDLESYEELTDLQESLDFVNKNLNKNEFEISNKNLLIASLNLYRYSRSRNSFKKKIYQKGDPKDLCKLGFLFISLKEYTEAKKAFQMSINIKPNAKAYQGLG